MSNNMMFLNHYSIKVLLLLVIPAFMNAAENFNPNQNVSNYTNQQLKQYYQQAEQYYLQHPQETLTYDSASGIYKPYKPYQKVRKSRAAGPEEKFYYQ